MAQRYERLVGFRMANGDFAALTAIAEVEGESLAVILRRAIRKEIAAHLAGKAKEEAEKVQAGS